MRLARSGRNLGAALIGGFLVLASMAPAFAHPRARPHTHSRARAVIVVGQPRPVRHAVVIRGIPHGVLDLNVKPKKTEVWVNGSYRGTVDAFDGFPGKLHLRPGAHKLRLVTPDGVIVRREIRVQAHTEIDIGLDLR